MKDPREGEREREIEGERGRVSTTLIGSYNKNNNLSKFLFSVSEGVWELISG